MPHDGKDGVHWHEPAGLKKAGLGEFKKQPTPYDAWMEAEGLPVFRGIGISKVQNLPLVPWKRTGGKGHFIQLYGTETKWGCYVVEVPPGGALNPEKHMYEEIYLVVEGRGSTEVWIEGQSKKHVFEWQKGSMFSIPMNTMHRIVNATSGGALLLGGTTAPVVLNALQNVDAVFNNPFKFSDRFSGADDFFKPKDDIEPDPVRGLAMKRTNFIPDIINCEMPLDNRRSPGYRRLEPHMGNQRFHLWIGQHETGRYSKAHCHESAAILICVKGKGYTYTWPEGLGMTPWKDGKGDKVIYSSRFLVTNLEWEAPAAVVATPPALPLAFPDTSPEPRTWRALGEGYMLTRVGMEECRGFYAPDPADWTHPYASPLLAPDLSGLPPAVITTCEFDPLRDEGEAYAARLAAVGVPVVQRRFDGQIHAFFTMGALIPGGAEAVAQACDQQIGRAHV